MSRLIYLAARYGRRDEMQGVAKVIEERGHTVTSSWIDEAQAENIDSALVDLQDVDKAEVLVLFTDRHGSFNSGGGRHFEMGYAYATGKVVCVIGDRETLFCHLPGIHVFPDLEAFLGWLSL